MLINYSCTNYKSYRYKNAFTFSASKIKQFEFTICEEIKED